MCDAAQRALQNKGLMHATHWLACAHLYNVMCLVTGL